MPAKIVNDLQAFVHVAREGSFTKAAAQLGVQSGSLIIRSCPRKSSTTCRPSSTLPARAASPRLPPSWA
ncbi:hypothetical protein C7E12_23040, partial [Stenotrophomonas maltophilia]